MTSYGPAAVCVGGGVRGVRREGARRAGGQAGRRGRGAATTAADAAAVADSCCVRTLVVMRRLRNLNCVI